MDINNNKNNKNKENIDLKLNNINNNNFLIGNIKLKDGDELFMTLFKIFSFLNICDVCNFIASSKKIAIVNSKDYKIYDIVLKIKKYVLFSDIRRVNFFSIDYFSKNSSFVTKNFINFISRTENYKNLTNILINKRQFFINGKEFSFDLFNPILKNLNLKKDDSLYNFYGLCNKVRIFTPIKLAIFENDFPRVKSLLKTNLVIMNTPKENDNYIFKMYESYNDSVHKFRLECRKNFNKLEINKIFLIKSDYILKNYNNELNDFNYNLKNLFELILREKGIVYLMRDISEYNQILNNYIYVNDCNLPIHQAAITGNVRIMKLILDYPNVNINAYNFYKQSPLYLSILHNNTDVALLLLNQKKINVNGFKKIEKINYCKNSPLIIAIKNKNICVIEKLVENPKLILDMVEENASPLIVALRVKYLEPSLRIIRLILNSSLKINVNKTIKNIIPYRNNYFHFNPNHKNISVLEYAIRKYSKINEENKDIMKEILYLIIEKDKSIDRRNRMKFLLDENLMVELLKFYGNCKLHLKKKTDFRNSNSRKGKNKKIKRDEKYKKSDKETKKKLDKIFERKSKKKSWKNNNNKKDKDKTKLRKIRVKSKGKW